MSSLSRELVFLILQFLDEEKFKETVHNESIIIIIMLGIAASIRGGVGIGRRLSFATRKCGIFNLVPFSITKDGYPAKEKKSKNKVPKYVKMSKKAKLNELRLYRLKTKKKMNSPNPEVRIRYKLEKAKRKEAWLIEKLRKFETPGEAYDPEILTVEEKHYLKRTGEKKKN
ncbi:hypothetical protein DKX38_009956 [Salix brachista]|uniref:TPL/SMU1 LisH-like dimerisation domain-containing protein n=1 Tax=Salix brachista TaxID=2182728 RepID=A0A5N5MC02_9ROSI|nr:hypothetical protein DKX38_009956 [Salix brachista]